MTRGGGLDGKIYKMYKKDFYAQCKYLCVQFFVWYIQISLNICLTYKSNMVQYEGNTQDFKMQSK